MAEQEKRYVGRYRYDARSRIWEAEVVALPEVHTFGRTLDKAQENLADALALWLEVPVSPGLIYRHDFDFDNKELMDDVMVARRERDEAGKLAERAAELTRKAALTMTGQMGLSVRDTARVLGVSHQRVDQIVRQGRMGATA